MAAITAGELARSLRGRRSGAGWVARCPAHDDRTPSLSIAEGDGGRILVKCFAGCKQAAVLDALRARGLWPGSEIDPARAERARLRRAKLEAEQAERQRRALDIWRAATGIHGSPAEVYLRSRGLDPARLMTDPPGWPETLRWTLDAVAIPGAPRRAALIAAVNDADSGLVRGLQRIFLNRDGTPVRRPDGKKDKKTLGPIDGNAARLSSWIEPAGRWGLAEGIETALAARQMFRMPVYAAVAAGNMPKVRPPRWARHATVFADHDRTGIARAAEAAAALRCCPWIESVRVVRAAATGADAADVLKEAAHG